MGEPVTSHAVPAPTSLLIRTANAFAASYTLIATGEIDGFASDTVETVLILRRSTVRRIVMYHLSFFASSLRIHDSETVPSVESKSFNVRRRRHLSSELIRGMKDERRLINITTSGIYEYRYSNEEFARTRNVRT